MYTKEDTLSCCRVPCAGFCETLELNISPAILKENMQLPPEATSISIEVKPQPAGGDPDTTHCGAFWANAGAAAATTNPSAATISTEHARIMCVIWVLH